ncbi:hypothetical protein KK137_07675 [Croceibacterium sp. LX-88]|uniref:Uncharacterized protein n=1 Tax=Croceibacterium selenioxidans TaxID=2838833 RepID=A0ABS5W4R8_9SPHN|nr:hypothetical protein [Croceibacterium selenioxidans]MBT2134205.1 hypothetical protein [Croceibacterium selenioxidans]
MFGISTLGWIHTIGSLPAIPVALYMFVRHGRIVPHSPLGTVYLVSMLVGAVTVFLIAHAPVSYALGTATILLLLAGYGAERILGRARAARYIETISLSLSAFLLMLPTITEVLRRVPDGHPLVTDLKSPLLLGAQGGLLVFLLVGLAVQVVRLARQATIAGS